MAYLIIVCPHRGRQPLWRVEVARRPACWHQPGLRAPFFVEMARLRARPSGTGNTETQTDRNNKDVLVRLCTVYGCPTSHTAQVFLSLRETPQVTEGGPCPPLSYPRTFRV